MNAALETSRDEWMNDSRGAVRHDAETLRDFAGEIDVSESGQINVIEALRGYSDRRTGPFSVDDPDHTPPTDMPVPCLIKPAPGSAYWTIADPRSDKRITHWIDVRLPLDL